MQCDLCTDQSPCCRRHLFSMFPNQKFSEQKGWSCAEWGALRQLTGLMLAGDQAEKSSISGTMPRAWVSLTRLVNLDLSFNRLMGPWPQGILQPQLCIPVPSHGLAWLGPWWHVSHCMRFGDSTAMQANAPHTCANAVDRMSVNAMTLEFRHC